MKMLKSDFSRVHVAVMLFALVNVLIGVALALSILPYGSFATVHTLTGALLLPLLILLPMLFRKRKNLYAALRARLLISRRDIRRRAALPIAAKAVTMLMALGFLIQLVDAFLLETGLAIRLFPNFNLMMFHTRFVYVLPALILLHVVFMKLAEFRKPAAGTSAA